MIRYVLLVQLYCVTTLAQPVMTVSEAIEIGLKNNYNIRIARNHAQIARNNAGLGTANFLPSLNATGGVSRSSADQQTNNPFSGGGITNSDFLNGQIALNWTLFDGFRMFADRHQFQELAKLGETRARNQIENTVVSILAAYFDLVQQEQLLQVQQEALEISHLRRDREKVRRELGGASSTDLLNAQVALNADSSALMNQEVRVLVARKNLNLALGRDPATPLAVTGEMVIPPLDMPIADLMTLAEERNSALLTARINQRLAASTVAAAWAPFLPRLTFNATYGYTDRTTSVGSKPPNFPAFPDNLTTTTTDATVGLSLTWNLFNGFRDKINRENARIEEKNQQLALENARNELKGLMQEKYQTLQKQLEIVALEQQNITAARQNLERFQERLLLGAATSLEFRDAQLNLIRARTTFVRARFQARITRLEIEQLTGRLRIE